jgi:hypothetical protein
VDKEILLNEILEIIERRLEEEVPEYVLINTAKDITDLFEDLGCDIEKLEETGKMTSWILKTILDERN